jgi:Protein of unknown function (DUF3040)
MDNRDTSQQIRAIEAVLEVDDPDFTRTFQHLQRKDARCALTVFTLLATGTVLAVTGLATQSLLLSGAGLALLAASPVLDRRHHLRLQHPQETAPARSAIDRTPPPDIQPADSP